MELSFSRIDAKEGGIIESYPKYIGSNDYKIIQLATKEYLEGLKELQKKIIEKYESQLTGSRDGDQEYDDIFDEVWGNTKFKDFGDLYYT